MKITTIPSLYRNLRRGREILAVLRRFGLADWLSRSQRLPFREWMKDRSGVPLSQYTRAQRIRMAITELGPTFIKVGQVLASRPDLVGPEIAEELKQLRSEVRPDTAEQVRETLSNELGDSYRDNFQTIDLEPLATASIGQVHRAVLQDGRRVVIKVQRSGIDRLMRQDLEVMEGLAQLASRVESLAVWGPSDMVRQLMPMVQNELDFNRERANLKQFAEVFKEDDSKIVVPNPVDELCTRRVLVMEELIGEPLASVLRGPKDPAIKIPDDLGKRLAKTYLKMVFEDGFFHADPHPGNLFCLKDGQLGVLDFGMTGRIDENLRETIEEMLFAINSGDRRRLTRLIRQVGNPRVDLDQAALEIDVAEFVDRFGRQSLDQFELGASLNQLTEMLHRHGISLPNQSALLLKMLVSLEGTLRELGVGFNTLEVVQTYFKKLFVRRLSPGRRLRQARRIYLESESLLEEAPEQVLAILNQARLGELQLSLSFKRFVPAVNRLAVGLMASAVFLGSSLLLAYNVSPVFFPDQPVMGIQNLSVLGFVGFVTSISVMVALSLAILRSE